MSDRPFAPKLPLSRRQLMRATGAGAVSLGLAGHAQILSNVFDGDHRCPNEPKEKPRAL